jgi:hypothetical protein
LEAKALKAFNLTVADYHTYFVAANDEADAVWVHNKCFENLPDGFESTFTKNEFGQQTYVNHNTGETLYKGHDGRYFDPKDHPPTPFANPALGKDGLTTEERADFRSKINNASTPEIADDFRYERNQVSRENRGLEPITREQWNVKNNQIRLNQVRGVEAENEARTALSTYLNKDLDNNNIGKTQKSESGTDPLPTSRPDSLGDGIVHEHKHFTGSGDNVVYNTDQMKAQRDGFEGLEHHVTISSDGPVNLDGVKPNPRPSGPLVKEGSQVSYYDINEKKITHIWDIDDGVWLEVD